jgi:hypothetical protein
LLLTEISDGNKTIFLKKFGPFRQVLHLHLLHWLQNSPLSTWLKFSANSKNLTKFLNFGNFAKLQGDDGCEFLVSCSVRRCKNGLQDPNYLKSMILLPLEISTSQKVRISVSLKKNIMLPVEISNGNKIIDLR